MARERRRPFSEMAVGPILTAKRQPGWVPRRVPHNPDSDTNRLGLALVASSTTEIPSAYRPSGRILAPAIRLGTVPALPRRCLPDTRLCGQSHRLGSHPSGALSWE